MTVNDLTVQTPQIHFDRFNFLFLGNNFIKINKLLRELLFINFFNDRKGR